jgi:hypothetical protein
MTDECISPLRRRMIEDMTVRNFAADTQRNYIRAVKKLAAFPFVRPGLSLSKLGRRSMIGYIVPIGSSPAVVTPSLLHDCCHTQTPVR